MSIYVWNVRKHFKVLISALIAISIIIAGIVISDIKAVQVFSSSRELPIYSVDSVEKKVAITFDCAWGADDIPGILKTLKENNVRATFFIVGQWAEKYPGRVKMISDEGHDIANHSYSHLRMGAIGNDKIKKEISLCGDKLSKISGRKVELFRAPYGDYNNSVIKTARNLGYYTIQWDVDSLDWKPGISQQDIVERVVRKVGKGSIILFHNDTPHTAKILPVILSSLKNKGFGFAPVSELIYREGYMIDYDGRQKKKK